MIGAIGVALLLSLGVWQVRRLAWKEGILAEIDARMGDAPLPVWQALGPAPVEYAPVVMEGAAGPQELHVLIGHPRYGPGYRVVVAFRTGNGRAVLLDEGFIRDADKDKPRRPLSGTVTGNLHVPDDRNSATPENDVADNIWFAHDLDQMAAALGAEPHLVVLRQAPGLDPQVRPMPLDAASIPNNHRQYAITWFALAVVWLGMTLYWLWRIRRRDI